MHICSVAFMLDFIPLWCDFTFLIHTLDMSEHVAVEQ